MNAPLPQSDIEKRKLDIEIEKLSLAKQSFYVDLISKIALPVALVAIAWATYSTNTKNTDARMIFDANTKNTEFRQKEDELFVKKSDAVRNRDALKAAFIQTNLSLIYSQSEAARRQVDVLARAVFPPDEIHDVLLKIEQIRVSAPRVIESSKQLTTPSSESYKGSGMQFAKIGQFDEALRNFEISTLLNPSDAEAWNFKAYSEMRIGNPEAALKSISTSIRLRPSEATLQHSVMLNATKILCSLGRTGEAASYINASVAAFPNLLAIARKDGELQQRCHFNSTPQ